jgi:hypothetical protein
MAGSVGEALAIINSVDVGALRTLGERLKVLGERSAASGRTLSGSAREVGAQRGEPYRAYQQRLDPVGAWMSSVQGPATATSTSVANAATVADQAKATAARIVESLSRYGVGLTNPATAGAQMAAAEAQALQLLNAEIDKISAAYGQVRTPDAGTAPVRDGATGADPAGTTGAGGATMLPASARSGGGPDGAGGAGGAADAAEGAAPSLGPDTGQYAGWVQDPNTGNLVDPATGREVDPSGRFVDPVTGAPFGEAADYASRLEGITGTGGGAGVLGPVGGVGLAPLAGSGGGGGIGGFGAGGFAGLYGGVVPPSLAGNNPAASQLRQKAADNLALKAGAARRYAEMMGAPAGEQQQQRGYLPPMAGAGAGTGVRAAGSSGRRLVSEPSGIWGGGRRKDDDEQERPASDALNEIEDADVWGAGSPSGSGLLG